MESLGVNSNAASNDLKTHHHEMPSHCLTGRRAHGTTHQPCDGPCWYVISIMPEFFIIAQDETDHAIGSRFPCTHPVGRRAGNPTMPGPPPGVGGYGPPSSYPPQGATDSGARFGRRASPPTEQAMGAPMPPAMRAPAPVARPPGANPSPQGRIQALIEINY